jgi:hypothetical protein
MKKGSFLLPSGLNSALRDPRQEENFFASYPHFAKSQSDYRQLGRNPATDNQASLSLVPQNVRFSVIPTLSPFARLGSGYSGRASRRQERGYRAAKQKYCRPGGHFSCRHQSDDMNRSRIAGKVQGDQCFGILSLLSEGCSETRYSRRRQY